MVGLDRKRPSSIVRKPKVSMTLYGRIGRVTHGLPALTEMGDAGCVVKSLVSTKMSEFQPYKEEETYKVILTRDETLLIQKLRKIKFGSLKVHKAGDKIVRTETTASELTKDRKADRVTIAFETITEVS